MRRSVSTVAVAVRFADVYLAPRHELIDPPATFCLCAHLISRSLLRICHSSHTIEFAHSKCVVRRAKQWRGGEERSAGGKGRTLSAYFCIKTGAKFISTQVVLTLRALDAQSFALGSPPSCRRRSLVQTEPTTRRPINE